MIDGITTFLTNWNASKNERQKMQYAYLVLTVAVILVAGIVSLFDPERGNTIVRVAAFTALAYVSNAVLWSLVQSGVISRLPSRPKRKTSE